MCGGGKKPRQALKARRLRHVERTVLQALAQRRKGGRAGMSREVEAAGCGVGGVSVSVGGVGGGGARREGAVPLVWARVRVCNVMRAARGAACQGGGGALNRQRSRAGPPVRGCGGCEGCGGCVVRRCGGVPCYLVAYYEEVARKMSGN